MLAAMHALPVCAADSASPSAWHGGVAGELGHGDGTDMQRLAYVAALTRPLWTRGTLTVSTFAEASVAHWRFPPPNSAGVRQITVVGVTPYLRLRDARWERWFVDFGIGVNRLSDLYETSDRRFSTHFQFSDHLGIGRSFGDEERFEISYRFVHYSNAGIRRPNPGANFNVLRLDYRF